MGLFQKFKKIFFQKDFIKFLCIGCFNTLNGVVFSKIFTRFLHPNIAFVTGYILSLTIAYLLNSKLNFKQNLSLRTWIKFCISYIPNFIIQNVIVLIVYNWLGFPDIIGFAAAAVIGLPVTFLLLKFFAFKDRKSSKES